jgi:hypothetical protein
MEKIIRIIACIECAFCRHANDWSWSSNSICDKDHFELPDWYIGTDYKDWKSSIHPNCTLSSIKEINKNNIKIPYSDYCIFWREYYISNRILRFGQAFINKFFKEDMEDSELFYIKSPVEADKIIQERYIDHTADKT